MNAMHYLRGFLGILTREALRIRPKSATITEAEIEDALTRRKAARAEKCSTSSARFPRPTSSAIVARSAASNFQPASYNYASSFPASLRLLAYYPTHWP